MRKLMIGCSVSALGVPLLLFAVVVYGAIFWNGHVGVETNYGKSELLRTPPPRLSEPIDLKVVTFNVQNLWVIGRNRAERMRLIGEYLTPLDPDIAGFQEVFAEPERELLIQSLSNSRLKYSQYYSSGTAGSGLLIMSAWPIKEVFFHRYAASNEWFRVWEGDWWAGKGIGLARIEHPAGVIDFYNTHAQAGYGRQANRVVRLHQMTEAADFVNMTRTRTAPALLVGDFNCRQGDTEYELLVQDVGLQLLMNDGRRIDNIFGVVDPGHDFQMRDFVQWDEYKGMHLSDHRGYMSTIRIALKP